MKGNLLSDISYEQSLFYKIENVNDALIYALSVTSDCVYDFDETEIIPKNSEIITQDGVEYAVYSSYGEYQVYLIMETEG